MKQSILIIIFSCAALLGSAQEKFFSDSIPKKSNETIDRQPVMDRSLIPDEMAISEAVNSLDFSIFHQPLLPDYNKNLGLSKYLAPGKSVSSSLYFIGSPFNPVFPYGHVFNQSSFQLSDRFLIGGSSFGAQSVFDLPKMNQTIQEMSIKGASMFMQYKVNDHFKVETRISISSHPNSPIEP